MLCCPVCKGELEHRPEVDEFACGACRFTFPIVDGIPVLFPCDTKSKMDQLFGRYWDSTENAKKYDDLVEGANLFGVYNHESEMYGLARFYRGSNLDIILDAGCGNGRFMETLPAGSIKVGVDASLNLLRHVKARGRGDFLVCAELEHLPFKDGLFGTVISCRVLQHLRKQEEAVREMTRVLRDAGDVILELYNTWNIKTIYKNIRMTKTLRKVLNAPFRAVFKSMSPFAYWGLGYDNYNNWFQTKGFMRRSGLSGLRGRGAGFGYHKWLFQPFYIGAFLENRMPAIARRYYATCFAVEKAFGGWIPFRWFLEKIILRGTKGEGIPGSIAGRAANKLSRGYKASDFNNAAAVAETKRGAATDPRDNRFHVEETVGWLERAHDATPDGGVSRAYAVGWNTHFSATGWQPSYPETTGYIIPTLYDCAAYFDRPDLAERARRMADWEIDVQMPSGAVMGGTVDTTPTPAIFNTGQVMLGWLRAHRETGEARYLEALQRAAAFLIEMQSEDGAWRKGNSRYASNVPPTYNARVGWAMILYGQHAGDEAALAAGRRNIEYTLSQQESNGWFRNNCISDSARPLLHTIAYAMEGLMGAYEALGDEACLTATRAAADPLVERIREDGSLAGRFDDAWSPAAEWSCLTGDAQLAGVLLRLATATGERRYAEAAGRILRFLKTTQNCEAADGGLRGGIKGSFPFDGEYGRYELLNWAAKFYVDALLLDERS